MLELVLRLVIPEPVEAHVHGFSFLLFDRIVGGVICSAVVGSNRWGGGMAEFNESEAKEDGKSGIEEKGYNLSLSLSSRCQDSLDGFGDDRSIAIDELAVRVAERNEASSAAGDEVDSIALNRKDHATSSVYLAGIWVADIVVEKVHDSLGGLLGAIGFGSPKVVESVHHGVVQCLCNIKELISDLLEAFGLFWHEMGGELSRVVNCCLAPY